jgi:hypothetical protein
MGGADGFWGLNTIGWSGGYNFSVDIIESGLWIDLIMFGREKGPMGTFFPIPLLPTGGPTL